MMKAVKQEQAYGQSILTRHRPRPARLKDEDKTCTLCPLHQTCVYHNQIGGKGSKSPVWLFVGEAPGQQEDARGMCFVGPTGQLLHRVLDDLGFPAEQCRFTNALRCWPGLQEGKPRRPGDKQIKICNPYLQAEIEACRPQVIVPLGNVALKACAGIRGISSVRGTMWEEEDVIYAPTFHPSYIYRDLQDPQSHKLEMWTEDLRRILGVLETGIEAQLEVDWQVIMDFEEARAAFRKYRECPDVVSYDYEYEGEPHNKQSKLLTTGFCAEEGIARCIPLQHREAPWTKEQQGILLEEMREWIEYRNEHRLPFVAYSAAAEIGWPHKRFGWPMPDPDLLAGDPYSEHHELDEEQKSPKLRQLAYQYTALGGYDNELERIKRQDKSSDPAKGGTYDNMPLDILGRYNCGDADVTRRLHFLFRKKLEEEGLWQHYDSIVRPATYPVTEYTLNGVKIDREFARKLQREYPARMQQIVDKARTLPDVIRYEKWRSKRDKVRWFAEERVRVEKMRAEGRKPRGKTPPQFQFIYNPGSEDQNREFLFRYKRFASPVLTPGGQPSINKEIKEILKDRHPLVPLIIEYGHLKKFKGTYVDRPLRLISDDGLAHFWFDLTGTVTGRLTSDFQQFPRGATNAELRKLICSRFGDDGGILEGDVSQGELRMFAITSQDQNLIRIYREGLDAHRMFASWIYGIDPEDVTEEQRSDSKGIIGFGVLYGRSAAALAADLLISTRKAQGLIDRYFGWFPGVAGTIQEYQKQAQQLGYVTNLLGRKRRLGAATSDDVAVRAHALRQAVNFPIQSLLHDLMLVAQYEIWRAFREFGLESKLLGEAHDSILVDYLKEELPYVATIVREAIEGLPTRYEFLNVPIVADLKCGPNWGEQEAYDAYLLHG